MKNPCIALVLITTFAAVGCQQMENPTPVLTRQQWKQVEANLLKAAPSPAVKVGAQFGSKIELIGYDIKQPVVAGKPTKIIWYWKALTDVKENWRIFVHLDSQVNSRVRQNLDHDPMDGLFVTSRWKKGMIIKDEQTITVRADYPDGQAIPYIGLWKGNKRMPITNDFKKDKSNRIIPPAWAISSKNKRAAKKGPANKGVPKKMAPRYAVRSLDASKNPLAMDGKLEEAHWKRLPRMRLSGIGRNSQNYETWAKMYYTKDHLVVGAYLKDEHIWGTLKNRDDRTWEQEVLELFLDHNGDALNYLELQITPANVIFDANFAKMLGKGEGSVQQQIDRAKAFNLPGLESAVHVEGTLNNDKDKDKYWSVELKIPLKSIPGVTEVPKGGTSWHVNLYRFDRPAAKQRFAYAWSTEANRSFHEVSKYGKINFMGTLPIGMIPNINLKGNGLKLAPNGKKVMPPLKRMPSIATPLKLAPGTKLKKAPKK